MYKVKYKLKKTNSVKEMINAEKAKKEANSKRIKNFSKGFRFHYILFPLAIVIIDQFTKYFVSVSLKIGEEITVVPGLFNIQFVINKGAALGILADKTIFLILVSLIMIGIVIYMSVKECRQRNTIVPELIIIGGALANLIDRIFLSGGVRDFLEVPFFAVMNFADWFVSLGIVLFVIKIIFYSKNEVKDVDNG